MSRSEVRVGQIWTRETSLATFKVKVIGANRTAVTYQVIEQDGRKIEDAIPITTVKALFVEQFTRELK